MLKKIVIIGPESTGKSTLCKLLAQHYHAIWCPEYAREYLLKNGTNYSYNDLYIIAKGQIALEEDYISKTQNTNNQFLFLDTDMYVMKVWCEYVFEKCHPFILEAISNRHYDLYLLCNTDVPWVKDELREYPNEQPRKELFHIYKDILINQPVPWAEINGNYTQRLQQAIQVIDKLFT